MENLLEMQNNVKAITRKHENNLIKLNVEVFRSIDGYESYAVSSFGRVKNVITGIILKTRNDKYGYLRVNLYEYRVMKTHKIHKLVANAFIDNPNNKQCVDHIDNNKANNHLTNLRWATSKENSHNSKLSSNNTSGCKGIDWKKKRKNGEHKFELME